MAMKKKFLPLLMAGMVVVGTTGLVNADTTTTVTGNDTETLQSSVSVSGTVNSKQGTAPAGRITVELPTKMAFAVDQAGNFKGGTYTVKNSSKEEISVLVSQFTKISGNINVVETIEPSTSKRGDVKLTLTGDQPDPVNLKRIETTPQDTLVAKVASGDSKNIILGGEAGTQTNADIDANGAKGEFNMVFKVKQTNPPAHL